jgi:hypothetical protein
MLPSFYAYYTTRNKCEYLLEASETSITISGVNNTPNIAIFSYRMCYGENGMVKFLETLADDVFRHNYSMMQILKKLIDGKLLGLPRSTPLMLYR